MGNTNYWCYRTPTKKTNFFINELNRGRLHHNQVESSDQSLSLFSEVKKGDILLILDLPERGQITIVEATGDWSKEETQHQNEKSADFTYVLRIKFLKRFTPDNGFLSAISAFPLRNTPVLRNISYYSEVVDFFRHPPISTDNKRHLMHIIGIIFKEIYADKDYSEKLYDKFIEDYVREVCFSRFVNALRETLPFHRIERIDTENQKYNGVNYLIKMHGSLPDSQYAIAIQIKLQNDEIDQTAIDQLNKAASNLEAENIKLLEKWIIGIGAGKAGNIKHDVFSDNLRIFIARERNRLLGLIRKRMRELSSI